MTVESFAKLVSQVFQRSLLKVRSKIVSGEITITGPYSFPAGMRLAVSPDHFIAELQGAIDFAQMQPDRYFQRECSNKGTTVEKIADANNYINPTFRRNAIEKPIFILDDSYDKSFANLLLATKHDINEFNAKLQVTLPPSRIHGPDGADAPLRVNAGTDRILICNCDLLATDANRLLFRTIATLVLVRRTTDRKTVRDWLEAKMATLDQPPHGGLNLFPADREAFARQLLSLADQQVTEATLDTFIAAHLDDFAQALGYVDGISQARLRWVASGERNPDLGIPDYLMKRRDGFYDILDLKRAALRSKVTKGKPSRIRFIDYVAELLSQLHNYGRYFELQDNANYAMKELGVKVQNPRLIGIVGNYDTFHEPEVERAMGPYSDQLAVMSYHDIVNLLRRASK